MWLMLRYQNVFQCNVPKKIFINLSLFDHHNHDVSERENYYAHSQFMKLIGFDCCATATFYDIDRNFHTSL
jgi:hypothetical protein